MIEKLWRRFQFLIRSRRFDQEMSEEIAFHLEMQIEENIADGMSPEEARRAAMRRFGNPTLVQENSRDIWLLRTLQTLWQDLRFSARVLRKSPGFTAVAALSLALCICANTTVFSIATAVLWRHLPVEQPDRLVHLYAVTREGRQLPTHSFPDYEDLQRGNTVFSGLAAHYPLLPVGLSGGQEPERAWGQMVSTNFFSVLGVDSIQGRTFLPEDDRAPAVAVISHRLWQRRFGSDPNAIGRSILLNSQPFTIVGVAPAVFRGLELGIAPDVWVPLRSAPLVRFGENMLTMRQGVWLTLTGRLKPGVTRMQAQSAISAVARQISETQKSPRTARGIALGSVTGMMPHIGNVVNGFVAAIGAVVLLVLLIACANVANLLLARAAARQKEMGIRLAIGAGRSRVVRQLLTESVLLALLGGAGGVLLAVWTTSALSAFHPPLPVPIDFGIALDSRVLTFTALLAMVAGILFGLVPAWQASRPDVVPALKEEQVSLGSYRRFGLRNILVVSQVALSLVLLVSTGLFLRSLMVAHTVPLGFRPDHLLLVSIDPGLNGYQQQQLVNFHTDLQRRLAAVPGITSVGITDQMPLSIAGKGTAASTKPISDLREAMPASFSVVMPHYFDTLGIPLVQGQDFSTGPEAARQAVINETLATRLWPGQSAIGRQLYVDTDKSLQVIGIVRDHKLMSLGEQNEPVIYRSFAESAGLGSLSGQTLVIRTKTPPMALAPSVRQVIRGLDRNLAIFNVHTMDEQLTDALFLPRLAATLFGAFGLIGVLLAGMGLYGVMSYAVNQRRHEIGVRMALGATARGVVQLVVGQGLTMTAIGIALGLAAAVAVAKLGSSLLATLLHGIGATDIMTFLAVPLILILIAITASFVPARRAARIDPLLAIRNE